MKKLKNSPIGYEIPQMEELDIGLRKFDDKFKSSDFFSPMFGNRVTDVMKNPNDNDGLDVVKAYDSYREDKLISEDQLKKEHGTIFPEFSGVEEFDTFNTQEEPSVSFTPVKEVIKEEPTISFEPVNMDLPKEDYSSKEQKLPPFFFQNKPVEPIVEEVKEEVKPIINQSYVEQKEFKEELNQFNNYRTEVTYKPKVKKPYKYPPLSLFRVPSNQEEDNPSFLLDNQEIINQTLKEFSVNAQVETYQYGPSVTRYEIKLAPGVNVKSVPRILDNIKMNLSAKTLRIEAPIPGKPHVGIEVPNRKAQIVHYYDIVNNEEFKNTKKPLQIALGKDIDGNSVYNSIVDMPHGLIAGATASGKSVCINTLLISLLLKNSPDELRLILIDPKMVELASYNDIPHLITPVITDATLAVPALKWAVDEMERRYTLFTETRVRNIAEYNTSREKNESLEVLPFIVIVIDEFGDLNSGNAAAELDEPIKRIAQKARAAGMHLILATQRPSTDVIRGTIKANIPGRIAFRVSQSVDSQTILDSTGAETLLGKGDMLIKTVDGLSRVQGAYIIGEDIDAITNYIRENNETEFIFTHESLKKNESSNSSKSDNNEENELLYSAAIFFINNGSCSTNGLQNNFNIGFNRAAKVVEQLSKMGIVSGKSGTVSREVLVTKSQLDEIFNIKG